MKRPFVKDIPTAREAMDIITGVSGTRCDLEGLINLSISNPPTQAEMQFLRAQLVILVSRIEG